MRKLAKFIILFAIFTSNTAMAERVLNVYTAEWCGPCKTFKRDLKYQPDMLDGYRVNSVDVDEKPKVMKEWDVKAVPTFIITDVENGKEVEISRLEGYNKKEFVKWLEAHKAPKKLEMKARH